MTGRSRIAQSVEQLTVNQRVVGSSPTPGATPRTLDRPRRRAELAPKAFRPDAQVCASPEIAAVSTLNRGENITVRGFGGVTPIRRRPGNR